VDYSKNKLDEYTAKNHSELAMAVQRKLEDII
jgi:hypothetical protein